MELFPPNPFIPAWSLSKSLTYLLLQPGTCNCFFKAIMMSLLHLKRAAVFCIQTWSLRKWYGVSCNTNKLLKTVRHVLIQYYLYWKGESIKIFLFHTFIPLFQNLRKQHEMWCCRYLSYINIIKNPLNLSDIGWIQASFVTTDTCWFLFNPQ